MDPDADKAILAASVKNEIARLLNGYSGPVALVTSGGTMVPLEQNMVRFLDNFRYIADSLKRQTKSVHIRGVTFLPALFIDRSIEWLTHQMTVYPLYFKIMLNS